MQSAVVKQSNTRNEALQPLALKTERKKERKKKKRKKKERKKEGKKERKNELKIRNPAAAGDFFEFN